MAEQRSLCSGCGHPRDESTATTEEGGRPLFDYEARSTVCYACEAKASLEDRIRKEAPEALRGRLFYTIRHGGE
jgi:hypothetical protein